MSESDKTSQPTNNATRQPKRRRRNNKSRRGNGARQQRWDLSQFQVPVVPGKWRFHDFNLPLPLMRAIHAQGFEYCTPIQFESLQKTLLGGDIVGKAQTGTGKTAAFLISILAYFLEEELPDGQKEGAPRALIVAPTRELALQIEKDAKALMRFTRLKVASAVGGMDYQKQKNALSRQLDVLVATPGRLLDFHQKRDLDLSQVEVLVLDEADRMLSMGFIPDVKRIIRLTPKKEERQTFLYSATFTQDIMNLAAQWTHEAEFVEIETDPQTANNIEQRVYLVSDTEKLNVLTNLIREEQVTKAIVFANRRDLVRTLNDQLSKAGVKVAMLSGEVPQPKRIKTLEQLRNGEIDILVATDVAGRGIHIDDVSHVINYTLPEDPEDYVHRIGRTGRAGASGVSVSFVGEEDGFALPDIEAYIKDTLPCVQPPEHLCTPAVTAEQHDARVRQNEAPDVSSERASEVKAASNPDAASAQADAEPAGAPNAFERDQNAPSERAPKEGNAKPTDDADSVSAPAIASESASDEALVADKTADADRDAPGTRDTRKPRSKNGRGKRAPNVEQDAKQDQDATPEPATDAVDSAQAPMATDVSLGSEPKEDADTPAAPEAVPASSPVGDADRSVSAPVEPDSTSGDKAVSAPTKRDEGTGNTAEHTTPAAAEPASTPQPNVSDATDDGARHAQSEAPGTKAPNADKVAADAPVAVSEKAPATEDAASVTQDASTDDAPAEGTPSKARPSHADDASTDTRGNAEAPASDTAAEWQQSEPPREKPASSTDSDASQSKS